MGFLGDHEGKVYNPNTWDWEPAPPPQPPSAHDIAQEIGRVLKPLSSPILYVVDADLKQKIEELLGLTKEFLNKKEPQ